MTFFPRKNMFNLDEEKIKFALDNRALVFWQSKKAEIVVILCFWRRDLRYLFVSYSWYCQIQTTRLIIFPSNFCERFHFVFREKSLRNFALSWKVSCENPIERCAWNMSVFVVKKCRIYSSAIFVKESSIKG